MKICMPIDIAKPYLELNVVAENDISLTALISCKNK